MAPGSLNATNTRNGANMTEIMQTMRDMVDAITQQASATTLQAQTQAQRDELRKKGEEALAAARGLAEFRHHSLSRFEGDHDPDKTDLWMQEIEKIVEVIYCTGETKLEYTIFLLIGEAESWWRGAKSIIHNKGEELTWGAFRKKFLDKYFPRSARAEKEAQFLRLHQSNMSVVEYAAKFESLAKYFRLFNNVVDENYKCERFESDLRYDIREVVAPHEIRQYKTLVEKCKKVENLKRSRLSKDFTGGPTRHRGNNYTPNNGRQQEPYPRTQGNGRDKSRANNRGVQSMKNKNQNQNQSIQCFRYQGDGHKSFDFSTKKRYFYICQKPNHLANNCPERSKNNPRNNNNNQVGHPTAQGRAYHIGGEGEKDHSKLIKGECEIYGKVFPILFDSGDTHSFISWECVDSLQLPVTHLPFNLVVTIPSAKPVTLSEARLQCPLIVLSMKFKVDLIYIPLKHLGFILGMDSLSNHYILLDCAHKSVIFPDSGIV
ncbi:uncharacterized protein LOC127115335 [Lathyrus oleraceus]|uniref:uncharacterized protein LOC127115335 n=1 Tax=Pisum sativum TaxID=3888 RepID=UPI0021D33410|nr:uncharacterized protein LOC127115335 [Pisum sativum]